MQACMQERLVSALNLSPTIDLQVMVELESRCSQGSTTQPLHTPTKAPNGAHPLEETQVGRFRRELKPPSPRL